MRHWVIWGSAMAMVVAWGVTMCVVIDIQPVTYVPFKRVGAPMVDGATGPFVTLPSHYNALKKVMPTIQRVPSISAISTGDVMVLPWHTRSSDLQFLPIHGVAFFDDPSGTIQVKQAFTPSDGYEDFLDRRVKMTIAGTVVLARGVHRSIVRHNDDDHPWRGTRQLFDASGINMVNFKSPLKPNGSTSPSRWVLVGKDEYANAMASANIHIAAIAGNHMGDAGHSGLLDTIQTLKQRGIVPIGAGKNMAAAYGCHWVDHTGSRYGFLAFNNVPGSIGKARSDSPGVAWLDDDALTAISDCRNQVDMVTVLVNWGTEYTHVPRLHERRMARAMIRAGATVVVGDQAHWVQAHESIGDAHVSYGLGNYIFDQHWSKKTTQGLIQQFILDGTRLVAIHTIPIHLRPDGSVHPVPVTSQEYADIMDDYYTDLPSGL